MGKVYLNNFMQGKVDVGRALGSGATGQQMEPREGGSRREVQGTLGGPPHWAPLPPSPRCAGPRGEAS